MASAEQPRRRRHADAEQNSHVQTRYGEHVGGSRGAEVVHQVVRQFVAHTQQQRLPHGGLRLGDGRGERARQPPAHGVEHAVERRPLSLADQLGARERHDGADALAREVGRIVEVLERLGGFQFALEQQPVAVTEVGPVPRFHDALRLAQSNQRRRLYGVPAAAVVHAVDAKPQARVRPGGLRCALHGAAHQQRARAVVRSEGVDAGRVGCVGPERAHEQRKHQQAGQQRAPGGGEQRYTQHGRECEQGQRGWRDLPARA